MKTINHFRFMLTVLLAFLSINVAFGEVVAMYPTATSSTKEMNTGDVIDSDFSSTSNTCTATGITPTRRTGSIGSVTLTLKATDNVTAIAIGGKSSGSAARSITKVEVNNTDVTSDVTISGSVVSCDELSVEGLEAKKDDAIKFTFSGNFQISYFIATTTVGPKDPVLSYKDGVCEQNAALELKSLKKDDFKGDDAAITYTCDNAAVTISGSTFTATADGEYTVTATQAATTSYKTGTTTFKVNVATMYNVTFAAGEGTGTMDAMKSAAGVEVTLPKCIFTAPDGKIFDKWTSDDVTITDGKFEMPANAVTVTATWAPVVTKVIYSWEGHADAAIEVGGTATGLPTGNEGAVNYAHNGYYTFQLGDKADYSGKYVSIALNEATKTGDIVKMTAYYYKDQDKTVGVKIADGSKAVILTSDNLPNIYDGTTQPANLTYTIPANVETNTLMLTRSATATTAFVTKFEITRVVGLVSREFANSIAIDGNIAEASEFSIDGQTITLTAPYTEAPAVALIATEVYTDGTQANKKVAVTLNLDGEFFTGTVTIGETTYTVKAEKINSFTVTYMDGETKLAEETVAANAKAANVPTPKKCGQKISGWKDASQNVINFETLTITEDVTAYAQWEAAYATTVDFEAAAEDGSVSVANVLYANNYYYTGGETTWDNNTSTNNGAYLGLKMKEANSTVEFRVEAGKTIILKVGILVNSKSEFYQNDVKVKENMEGGSKTSGDNYKEYIFTSATEAIYKFQTTAADAQIIKAITITDNRDAKVGAISWNKLAVNNIYTTATAVGLHGTICLPYDCSVSGAEIYQYEYRSEEGLVFDFASEQEVKAGHAYVYFATSAQQEWTRQSTVAEDAVDDEMFVGTYANIDLVNSEYILYHEPTRDVFRPAGNYVYAPAFRAYIPTENMPNVNGAAIRIVMPGQPNNPNVTGVEEATAAKATKALVNGKLVIVRGAHTFNANGAILK